MDAQNSQTPVDPQIETHQVESKPKKNKFFIIVGCIVLLILIALTIYFVIQKQHQGKNPANSANLNAKPVLPSGMFAQYKAVPVNISPNLPAYTINPDLSNITNTGDFTFSDAAKNSLVKNAFVVNPVYNDEFYTLYEGNRYEYIPSFITTDSMLHNYHIMFDYLLKQVEVTKLIPILKQLNANMLTKSIDQYNSVKGTSWENAAKRNVAFFAVGSKLLDPTVTIPPIVAPEADQELALIDAHQGITASPVMNMGESQGTVLNTPQGLQPVEALKEDYTQYIPRGHYDTSPELQNYFKSMMWFGRMTFRFKEDDEIKSATLMTLALDDNNNQKLWSDIYDTTGFFVGSSDDIDYYQFNNLVEKIYGKNPNLQIVASDTGKFTALVSATQTLEPPQINSMPIFNAAVQPDRTTEIMGFRFMGQRFTIDAAIFQNLIVRAVGPKGASCANAPFSDGRWLPKGLDITSAMGSQQAYGILNSEGETQYACYPENMAKMQPYIAGLPTTTWTQNLYWGWLYSLLPLTQDKLQGYPSFMQNAAWLQKSLETYLGSWTELKHDTILYAKQVYAEMGGGGAEKKDDRGYVEPNPYVYARLASLITMTQEGLDSRGLLPNNMKDNLTKLDQLALSLKTISEKELNNQKLSDSDYELIRSYGGQLEHFWIEVNQNEPEYKELGQTQFLIQNPAALVADVATDPNGQVLEEGTGKIFDIYVVVPIDGKLRIAKGGVYSQYEFPWPMSDRLTDTKWREMLDSDQPPQLPQWTSTFITK